jgi:hypothetical protein
MPGLQLLYNNHVKTYEKICDKHKLRFIPLAFDTLGRMHPGSAKLLHNAFINHRLDSTKALLPSRDALWQRARPAFYASGSTAVLRACRVPACATHCSISTRRSATA